LDIQNKAKVMSLMLSPLVTYPIRKNINTELLIDKRAAPY